MSYSANFLLFSCSAMSYSLQSHGLQHTRLPYPSSSPKACSNSSPVSQWCYPTQIRLWCPLLLLPSICPSIRIFSNESALHIRWPKYWSFSFSISLSKDYLGLIFFKIDWFDLLAVQGTLRVFSSTTIWKQKFFSTQPSLWSSSYIHTWLLEKNHHFDYMDLCLQSNVSAF